MVGKITLNDATQGHVKNLKELGFEVDIETGDKPQIVVSNISEFISDEVDISTKEKLDEVLADAIKNKKAFTYSTRFVVGHDEDGDPIRLFSFPAARKLGAASCLMMKKAKKGKKKKSGMDLDALKALANGE